jgi:predicted lipoprotein with Yx(FWY)xxD motif
MMLNMRNIAAGAALAAAASCLACTALAADKQGLTEAYVEEPTPPGFKVMISPLDGPIYTTLEGKTLYTWPRKELRNGGTGDMKGSASNCDDVKTTENAGMMSPYPGGLELPDLDTRPTCAQAWPPVIAADNAKPVGKWTLIPRHDKHLQWAYNGQVLYTSRLDRRPGDTIGGTKLDAERGNGGGDAPAHRIPIGPPADVPGQFIVQQNNAGRQLVLENGLTVYAFDGDAPNKSNCNDSCARQWTPVAAPEIGTLKRKDWSVVQRKSGERQWAYRSKPLYTFTGDGAPGVEDGLDVDGWHAVFTQPAPAWPKSFTVQDTRGGTVLADARGHTLYIYNCGDDSKDQLACDHPDTTQAYRYAVCGGGDPIRCVKTFPYVVAAKGETSINATWTVVDIDPKTGHRAQPGQEGSLRVWAYRDRPVYTFIRDIRPGTARAQSWGEFYGARNGYYAFWLRLAMAGRVI